MPQDAISEQLHTICEWLQDTPLPDAVEIRARALLLDTIGCMVAGLAKPELLALAARHAQLEPGPIRLPGCAHALSLSAAANLSVIAACWDEACEGLARAHGRPGLHAFGGVLALALLRDASLDKTLHSLACGYEVGGRMGETLRIVEGMHVDGTWGSFAALAGAARLLEMPVASTVAALEACACQLPFSLYLPVAQGATTRNTYVGGAAVRALQQVLATEAGVTAPTGAISRYNRLALGATEDRQLEQPGVWLLAEGYLKPFAAVRHVHYAAQAALQIRERGVTGPAREIRLRIYPEAIRYCGNRAPATAIQAQFSLSYGLAHALLHGDLGPEAYLPERLHDEALARLESFIRIEATERFGSGRGAELWVRGDTAEDSVVVEQVAGDPGHPLSLRAVEDKFLRYAAPHIGERRAQRMAEALLQGDAQTSLARLLHG
ncbi:MAG: MmgE/PrpD family protein [Gammaproteobacteria bacterium]|nr:MmgE/PrpD family protein [Gammaproteobacteria bacterium]